MDNYELVEDIEIETFVECINTKISGDINIDEFTESTEDGSAELVIEVIKFLAELAKSGILSDVGKATVTTIKESKNAISQSVNGYIGNKKDKFIRDNRSKSYNDYRNMTNGELSKKADKLVKSLKRTSAVHSGASILTKASIATTIGSTLVLKHLKIKKNKLVEESKQIKNVTRLKKINSDISKLNDDIRKVSKIKKIGAVSSMASVAAAIGSYTHGTKLSIKGGELDNVAIKRVRQYKERNKIMKPVRVDDFLKKHPNDKEYSTESTYVEEKTRWKKELEKGLSSDEQSELDKLNKPKGFIFKRKLTADEEERKSQLQDKKELTRTLKRTNRGYKPDMIEDRKEKYKYYAGKNKYQLNKMIDQKQSENAKRKNTGFNKVAPTIKNPMNKGDKAILKAKNELQTGNLMELKKNKLKKENRKKAFALTAGVGATAGMAALSHNYTNKIHEIDDRINELKEALTQAKRGTDRVDIQNNIDHLVAMKKSLKKKQLAARLGTAASAGLTLGYAKGKHKMNKELNKEKNKIAENLRNKYNK